MSRRWIGIGIIAGVSAGVLAWGAGARLADRPAETIEITAARFERQIEAQGEVRSANSVSIGCPAIPQIWSFTITRLAPEGEEVRSGTPLVSFDKQKLQEQLQVLQSQLETAGKELEKTQLEEQEKLEQLELELAELRAKKAKLDQKLEVPEIFQKRLELEKLRLDHELAEEELRLVGLRIETQRDNQQAQNQAAVNHVANLERRAKDKSQYVEMMDVRAPKAGFVVHTPSWNGEKPKVGESTWVGRSILELADLSRMEVAAEVAEPDAGHVQVGQRVEIRLDASPERLFQGRVTRLGRLFRTKSDEVPSMIFDAVVAIDEPDPDLMRPGMAAKLLIVAETADPVIQVPEEAVRVTERGPEIEVRRPNGRVERVAVVLGPRWRGRVIVDHGLEDGDRVQVTR